jgi:hypothetical protein
MLEKNIETADGHGNVVVRIVGNVKGRVSGGLPE